MAYVKSILAGIVASTAMLAILYAVGLLIAARVKNQYQASQPGDYFIEWHFHFWPILFVALVIFAFGFCWEFRRASIRPSPR